MTRISADPTQYKSEHNKLFWLTEGCVHVVKLNGLRITQHDVYFKQRINISNTSIKLHGMWVLRDAVLLWGNKIPLSNIKEKIYFIAHT